MTNYQTGHDAEKYAVDYLVELKYKIHDINWKTKYCEIDIVAEKNNTIYFVEVKYRQSSNFGTGLEYITPKKHKQMTFAAEMWISNNDWSKDAQLAVIEITGPEFKITNFVELT